MSGNFNVPQNIPPPPDYPAPHPLEDSDEIIMSFPIDEPLLNAPLEERLDNYNVAVAEPEPPILPADNPEQPHEAQPIAQMQIAVGGPAAMNRTQVDELSTRARGARMLATAGSGTPTENSVNTLSQQITAARRGIVSILQANGQNGGQPGILQATLESNAMDLPVDGLDPQQQAMVTQLRDIIVQNQTVLNGPPPDRGAMRALVNNAVEPRARARNAADLDPQVAQTLSNQIANGRHAIAQLFKNQGLLPNALRNTDIGELESHIDQFSLARLSIADRALVAQVREMIAENLQALNAHAAQVPGGIDFARPLFDTSVGLGDGLEAADHINQAQTRLFQDLLDRIVPEEVTKGRGVFHRTLKPADAENAMSRIAWGFEQTLKSNADARAVLGTFTADEKESFVNSWLSDFKLNADQKVRLATMLRSAQEKHLPMPPTAPGSRLVIGNVLGAGGAGEVSEGTFDGKPVVVKTLRNRDAAAALLDVLHEITAQGRTDADVHIPKVVGLFEENDLLSIVMERVTGRDLDKIGVNIIQNLPSADRAKVALHVAAGAIRGFAAMHSHGLIHRDIKPDNIMYDTNTMESRLIDFGSAFSEGGLVSNAVTMVFLAPERDSPDHPITNAADVFSFGATLYDMVGGQLWAGFRFQHHIEAAWNGGQAPGAFNEPGVWTSPEMGALRNLITATWDRNPEDRPTFRQMQQALNGEAVTAAAPGERGLKAANLNLLDILRPDLPFRQQGRELLSQALAQAPG